MNLIAPKFKVKRSEFNLVEFSRVIKFTYLIVSYFLLGIPAILVSSDKSSAIIPVSDRVIKKDKPELKKQAENWIHRRPVKFLENKGQMFDMNGAAVPFVLFRLDAPGMELYITEKGLNYVFSNQEKEEENIKENDPLLPQVADIKKMNTRWEHVEMSLKNASIKKENIVYGSSSTEHFNYFYMHCPNGIHDVKQYDSIVIKNIYPGVDWALYNSDKTGFKYDFIIHPGADPDQIEIVYSTLEPLKLEANGNIKIKGKLGNLTEKAPVSYLKENSLKVESDFKIESQVKIQEHYETTVKFGLKNFVKNNQTLVIDPQLYWSTFYGSPNTEAPSGIETDNSGNVFIVGLTAGIGFPLLNSGSYFQGNTTTIHYTTFILKFSNTGVLLWGTFYGNANSNSNGIDVAHITHDKKGNIFISGITYDHAFPLQNAGTFFQPTFASSNGYADLFILKFDNNGNRLWATYYGGVLDEHPYAIDADTSGNIFIAGITNSGNFPLQNNSGFFQSSFSPGNSYVGFILKFDNSGNRLWATFFGDQGTYAYSLCCDVSGNVFITGMTSSQSPNVPLLNPGSGAYFQASTTISTVARCFVTKFNNVGTILWSTLYGGSGQSWGNSIVTDANGNVFVMGSAGANLPLLNAGGAYFQGSMSSGPFFLKFTNTGVRLWATYYQGTSNATNGYQIFTDNLAVDTCGNLYASYTTGSSNNLLHGSADGGYFKSTLSGSTDIFLLRFSNTGSLHWATYFGGDGSDFGSALAVDKDNNLFVTGVWQQPPINFSYPVVNPGGGAFYTSAGNGGPDIYISKFLWPQTATLLTSAFFYPGPFCINSSNFSPITFTNFVGGGIYSSSPGLNIDPVTGFVTTSLSVPGIYVVNYTGAYFGCQLSPALTSAVIINSITPISLNSPVICAGKSATMSIVPAAMNAATCTWTPSGATTFTLATSATATTIYTITGKDGYGCAFTVTTTLHVNPLPSLSVTGNNTVCSKSPVTQTISGASSYTWSTGANTNTVNLNPIVDSIYGVAGTDTNGCVNTVTIFISVQPLPTIILNNSTICKGITATLIATSFPASGVTFSWLPGGETTDTLLVNPNATSMYTVIASHNGCSSTTSNTVTVTDLIAPVTTFSYTSPICPDSPNPMALVPPDFNPGGHFLSSSGLSINSTDGLINLSSSNSGTYLITYNLALSSCTAAGNSTFNIVVHPSPTLQLSPQITIAPGSNSILSVSGGSSYTWTPTTWLSCIDCPTPMASPPENTVYCVVASNGFCMTKACVNIEVTCSGHDLSVPNAFTPNGDGNNDAFCLQGWDFCISQFLIIIFDRWGENIYESTNPDFCWDGIYKGQPLSADVFVYVINAAYTNNSKIEKKGNITLIR